MSNTPISLQQILALVGSLDDTPGSETPRERFRRYLQENVREVGQLRDYVEECLRTSGDQYSRALQDLVNRTGQFLGFNVQFGRYQGVVGKLGFDGYWVSPSGFHIVAEVKTSEVYAAKAATLVGYVDGLISERQIPSWDVALGLYVVGRPDPGLRTLEHAIVAERRTHQLRVVSTESLLSLAEVMQDYDVTHDDILALLRPTTPMVDAVVDLLTRLVAGPRPEGVPIPESTTAPAASLLSVSGPAITASTPTRNGGTASSPAETEEAWWLTAVKGDDAQSAEEVIQALVGREHVYAFGERTPGRKHLKPGDWIAFYAAGSGVAAHARVASRPENTPHRAVRHPEKYLWTFRLDDVHLYTDSPVVIDEAMRGRLDAFCTRNPTSPWAWFVQATRRVSHHDFDLLTHQ